MKRFVALVFGLSLASAAGAEERHYITGLWDHLAKPDEEHVPELKSGLRYGNGLDARYGTILDDSWGYELRVARGTVKTVTGVKGYHTAAGAKVLYRFGEIMTLTPYLAGGGILVYSDFGSETLNDPSAGFMFDLGGGLETKPLFNVFGFDVAARAEVTENYEHYDHIFLDVRTYLGLQFSLPVQAPAAPVETVAVVPVEPTPEVAPAPAPEPVVEQPLAEPTIIAAKAGDTIVLKGVNFETAKAVLTMNAQTILDGVAEQLNKRPDLAIEVGGHTDSRGNDAYNQDLSERRALSVVEYLTAHAVDPARLTYRGYGETVPVADNGTPEGRESNRRVELKVAEAAPPAETTPPAQ